jgi:hypothetical protein
VKVGVGSGPDPYFLQYSTVVGKDALVSNTYGWQNNAFGFEAMNQNTTGNGNNAFGLSAMRSNTSGNNNVAVGQAALHSSVTGNMNTAIGASAAYHSLGSQVTSIGYESLMGQGTGTGNTALGWRAGAAVYGNNTFSTFLGNNATAQNGTTNATAIGNDAFVNTSNTIQLGNTSITNVKTSGTLTAGNVTYPNNHNSVNGQILTTNGSGVASWTNTIAIANGGTGATTSAAALTNLGAAPLVSPTFTGTPTATTASTGTNNTQVATTAFVNSSISIANSSLAPIWSPSFNGTPTAPTAAANTNTTQIATTAFVASALTTAGLPSQSGNNGKFLTTNGSSASWAASPGVPYSGATGAVNLGAYNLTVNNVKVGVGSGPDYNFLQNSTAVGRDALFSNTTGSQNSAFGRNALYSNTTGNNNHAFGMDALGLNTTGNSNVAIGQATLNQNISGINNTAVGHSAAYHSKGSNNTAIGYENLDGQTTGAGNTGVGYRAGRVPWGSVYNNSTFIGYDARPSTQGFTNATAIGFDAIVEGSNMIQLGNGSVTNVKTNGTITAGSVTYPKTHNSTNGQVLTVNASGTASWTSPSSGITGSGTVNSIPKFSTTTALSNSSLSDDGTGLRIGNPNGTGGVYTGLSSYDNTRLMVSGGREYESIRMTFPGDPYNNELSFNWYGTAWRMRTERSSGDITDLSFWRTAGGTTTEAIRIKASGNFGIGINPSQKLDVAGNVKFSGALMPNNSAGTSGQVLTSAGANAVPTWTTPASSGVPYTGATGAVNLGAYNLTVNEITIGKGNSSLSENTVVGKSAMANVTGNNNTAIGSQSMPSLTSGAGNTAIGSAAGYSLGTGSNNIIMGYNANMSGNPSNSIAIGTGIDVNTSNTIQLGNSSSTTLKTFAKITSGTVTYPNTHNSVAGQVLTTDASGIATWANPSVSIPLATAMEGLGVTLNSSHNGYIFYAQNAGWPNFPTNLPDGFQCTIVNYSTYSWSSNTLSGLFYLKTTNNGTPGSNNSFTILPGGTAIVNVVTIQGAKRYYIMN